MYDVKPSELYKSLGVLKGILKGVSIDGIINDKERKEVLYWCENHNHYKNMNKDIGEIIFDVETIFGGKRIIASDVLKVCRKCEHAQEDGYYDKKHSLFKSYREYFTEFYAIRFLHMMNSNS